MNREWLSILILIGLMFFAGRGEVAPGPEPKPDPSSTDQKIAEHAGRDFLLTIADKLDTYAVPDTEQQAFEDVGKIIADARKSAFMKLAENDEAGDWDRATYQARVKQYAAGFREAVQ